MKGDAAELLAQLREREAAMVELLRTLVDIDSPSGDAERVAAVQTVVERELQARGASVERVSAAGVADHLVARFPGSGPRVLILAHADTVWPADETQRRPFQIASDRYTGPGVFDMKAGIVQALTAVAALQERHASPPVRVTMAVTSDEESGSVTSRPLVERLAREHDVVLVVEPATGTKLKTARKGIGMYELQVEGRAAHAGLDPEQGRSAVLELAHQVIALHALTDFAQGTTVCVGIASGGSGRNVVPAAARATIDLRVVSAAAAADIDARIKQRTPVTPDTTVRVTGGINRPPMERTAVTAALYARAERCAEQLGLELGEVLSGGGSDGNFTAAIGVPTLDGLGAVGGGAHALDEHVLKGTLAERSALLVTLLESFGRDGVPSAASDI